MNFKSRRHKEGAEVSTESLNDIMFFLLLFFLIISTLVNPSVIKLNLANSKNSEQVQANSIQLQVTSDFKYHINNRLVSFGDLEKELAAEIKNKTNAAGAPTVILGLDKELSIQDLVDVMQIGARLNVKMVLATKKTTKS
jgi:biopolymer transport protein ExbD